MKKDIHPKYEETTITCACGAVIHTRSTKKEIKVGVCSKCHPFFTGTQKYVDTAGRVEKFLKKYAGVKPAKKKVRTRKGETTVPVAEDSVAPASVAPEAKAAPEVEAVVETPAQETSPAPEAVAAEAPAKEEAPAPVEASVKEEIPAPAETPVEKEKPAPAEASVKEEKPAKAHPEGAPSGEAPTEAATPEPDATKEIQ